MISLSMNSGTPHTNYGRSGVFPGPPGSYDNYPPVGFSSIPNLHETESCEAWGRVLACAARIGPDGSDA